MHKRQKFADISNKTNFIPPVNPTKKNYESTSMLSLSSISSDGQGNFDAEHGTHLYTAYPQPTGGKDEEGEGIVDDTSIDGGPVRSSTRYPSRTVEISSFTSNPPLNTFPLSTEHDDNYNEGSGTTTDNSNTGEIPDDIVDNSDTHISSSNVFPSDDDSLVNITNGLEEALNAVYSRFRDDLVTQVNNKNDLSEHIESTINFGIQIKEANNNRIQELIAAAQSKLRTLMSIHHSVEVTDETPSNLLLKKSETKKSNSF